MITIVLADDHEIVRRGIKMLLEEEKDLRVVGEASSSAEAVRLVEALRPDRVESEPGKGSTFYFSLPVAGGGLDEKAHHEDARRLTGHATKKRFCFGR